MALKFFICLQMHENMHIKATFWMFFLKLYIELT